MATLAELTVQVLAARLTKKEMSLEELQKEMVTISQMIKLIDEGVPQEPAVESPPEETKPQLTIKQAFKKDEIICMVCSKGGYKTLKKHLSIAHQLTPGEYRKQFGLKSTQKLAAKSFSEAKRQAAVDRGMVDVLAKARETRMANIAKKKTAVPAEKVKTPTPTKEKVTVSAKKTKTQLPAVKEKTAVPAVRNKTIVPVKTTSKK